MKKFFAIFLAFLLVFTYPLTACATENEEGEEATTEHPETTEYPDDPTKEPALVANSAIVIDAETGKILFEKNAHQEKYPASITKIMTTLLALEADVDFNEVITMSENSIWGVERDSTLIGLDVGEQVTMGDLMFATMVKSANECAYAVAERVGGDIENFANMMNDKAREIGCEDTHFVTPNGLHDDDHYTTAYDMALITREALKYEKFRELSGTLSYTVPETNLAKETRPLWNGNQMINPAKKAYYEYCEGGKTGYTTMAHNTLMTYAKKDGLELICIIMDCDGNQRAYSDTRALYNYCFNNYTYFYPLSDFSFGVETETETEDINSILNNYYSSLSHDMIDLEVNKNYSILINRYLDTSQVEKHVNLFDKADNNVLGEITFTLGDEQIGSTPITSSTPLLSSKMTAKEDTSSKKDAKKIIKKIFLVIACIAGVLLLIVLIYFISTTVIQRFRRGRRRRNYRRSRRRHRRDNDYYF